MYDGEWREGAFDGRGTYTTSQEATIYVGTFKRGKRHGVGELLFASGTRYFGEFCDGKREGRGECSTAAGVTYSGQWLGGFIQGPGALCLPVPKSKERAINGLRPRIAGYVDHRGPQDGYRVVLEWPPNTTMRGAVNIVKVRATR